MRRLPKIRPRSTPATASATLARAAAGLTGAAAAGLVYASAFERNNFTLRKFALPVLSPGSEPLTLLHISDIHMLPEQRRKQEFLSDLAGLEPDLVVNTGDNLASARAVPATVQALEPLFAAPGAFVFGSNDYYAPVPKSPLPYLGIGRRTRSDIPLPWRDLRAAFSEHGWLDATHRRTEITAGGSRILVSGVDDPHEGLDDYESIAGPAGGGYDLRIGLLHSPEPRLLDRFDSDGYDLALAGHTHGGQLRTPFGPIITNSGIDRSRARGASVWGRQLFLHVSAGLGTSPFVPLRTFCAPEASLLRLLPRPSDGGRDSAPVEPVEIREPLTV